MNVAGLYPARVQSNGTTWYRPCSPGGGPGPPDMGWTSELSQAHPDYHTTPKEIEDTMLALDENFEPLKQAKVTEFSRYPMPEREAYRAPVGFGMWGWYDLPSVTGSGRAIYPRATTISGTLDEKSNLELWKRREIVKRVVQLHAMRPDEMIHDYFKVTAGEALKKLDHAINSNNANTLNSALDTIDNLMGGADAREFGTCIHAWLEAIWTGNALLKEVPTIVRPYAVAALKAMAIRGLIARPEYIERVVLNDQGEEIVAGRIDCIWELAETGELVMGDTKTNKDLSYSWLSYGVQIGGVYGWATKMLSVDGQSWEPMPELNRDFAIILHVPNGSPEKTSTVAIDVWWGGSVLVDSLRARALRKGAKTAVPSKVIPAPSDKALRLATARVKLSAISSLDDGQKVFDEYQDVWNDDIDSFANTVVELL